MLKRTRTNASRDPCGSACVAGAPPQAGEKCGLAVITVAAVFLAFSPSQAAAQQGDGVTAPAAAQEQQQGALSAPFATTGAPTGTVGSQEAPGSGQRFVIPMVFITRCFTNPAGSGRLSKSRFEKLQVWAKLILPAERTIHAMKNAIVFRMSV